MTVAWHKKLITLRHVRGLPPEGSSVEYVWRCWKTNSGAAAAWDPFSGADDVLSSSALALPRPGEKVSTTVTALANTWADYFRWRQVSWSMVDSSMSVWEATATATSKDVYCGDPNVTRTDSVSTRKVDLYRDHSPQSADYDGAEDVDAGNHTNDNGTPTDNKTIAQVQVDITFLWNTADPQAPGYPNIAGWSALINRRNEEAFIGFEAGTVLFAGVSIDPEQDEYVRVTYTFLWDAWAHLTQEPARWLDGRVVLEDSGITSGGPSQVAKVVYWTQPYPDKVDFNDAFTEYELGWLEQGWGYRQEAACLEELPSFTGSSASLPLAAQLNVTAGIRDGVEEEEEEEEGEPEPPPEEE